MKKRLLSTLLALCMVLSLLPGAAWAATSADSDFVIQGGVLTDYTGNGGDVTIPDGVTSIGNRAFMNGLSLTSVIIPNSVISIGDYAFYNCTNMVSVIIGNSVTSIGAYAFMDCRSLTGVAIPDSVTTIKDFAFYNCKSLTSVTIGDSVTSIGENAFLYCSSLTRIAIPDSVTSIGGYAFHGCKSLTSVTLGDSVTFIGEYAFAYCSSLTSITIPDSVTTIENSAFASCTSLTSVAFGIGITSIGDWAFGTCSNLTNVYYIGTEGQWKLISIRSGNEPLTKGTVHYNSRGPTSAEISNMYPAANSTVDLWINDLLECSLTFTSEIEVGPGKIYLKDYETDTVINIYYPSNSGNFFYPDPEDSSLLFIHTQVAPGDICSKRLVNSLIFQWLVRTV